MSIVPRVRRPGLPALRFDQKERRGERKEGRKKRKKGGKQKDGYVDGWMDGWIESTEADKPRSMCSGHSAKNMGT